MNIYIEKEFLDNFYIDWDIQTANPIQKIVYDMLTKYQETKWFIDCSEEHLFKLEQENLIVAEKANYFTPIPIKSIEEQLFKSKFKQEIVFTYEEKDWFTNAEDKGALCFSFNSYQRKIQDIIKKNHYRIDLSDKSYSFTWSDLVMTMPFNKIVINDGYILVDDILQKMADNIIPLLKAFSHKNLKEADIYTIAIFDKKNSDKKFVTKKMEERLTRLTHHNQGVLLNIIDISRNKDKFHDRVIYNNFQTIDCGKGFNLLPHKPNNSQIISETIFNIYSYKRLKNLKRLHDAHISKQRQVSEYAFTFISSEENINNN